MRRAILFLAVVLIMINGCSDKHGDSPTSFSRDALPAPENLVLTPGNWEINISWEYPSESQELVESFLVYRYYITAYGEYLEIADTTSADVMEFTDQSLVGNVEYCYVVSAVDSSGMEGWRSGIECDVTLTP